MSPWAIILGAGAIAGAAWALAPGRDPLEPAGAYIAPKGDRVLAFTARPGLSGDGAVRALDRLDLPAGRLSVVVVYRHGEAPGDKLAASRNIFDALALIDRPPYDRWSHRLRVNEIGNREYR